MAKISFIHTRAEVAKSFVMMMIMNIHAYDHDDDDHDRRRKVSFVWERKKTAISLQ